MDRFAIKIAGASGQGINTVGEILAFALKRAGFCVLAYREYPSLIKGGHATYQIDFAVEQILGTKSTVDVLMILNKQKTDWHLDEMKQGGVIFHDIDNPRINSAEQKIMQEKNLHLVYVPALKMATAVGGNELMTNLVSLGTIWKNLGMDYEIIKSVVEKVFATKPKILPIDLKCIESGYNYKIGEMPAYSHRLIKPDEIPAEAKTELHSKTDQEISDLLKLPQSFIDFTLRAENFSAGYLITGNEAIAIGAVRAGVRAHFAYPMTPSSSIMDYLAKTSAKTGLIVKQAEDEITAAAMALGAMHAGTRAMTATSGGGFDLMTEHVSLAGIFETPFVCVLAQRPGPATGLPTWTTQGDLWLALHGGHGEFARCVIAVSDPEDAFYSIQEAFNIAEQMQIVVVVLTDKLIAETFYTIKDIDQDHIGISRGIVSSPSELAKLKSSDRFKFTESGISPRWLPGVEAADYNANSDEHDEEGNVTEEAEMSQRMISKRIRKENTLLSDLPAPELHWNDVDLKEAKGTVNFVGWGSTKAIIFDVMKHYAARKIKVNYLHLKYIWPLHAKHIVNYLGSHDDVILLEGNHNGQLAELIKMKTGMDIPHKFLKWDGRPFFLEEVIDFADKILNKP